VSHHTKDTTCLKQLKISDFSSYHLLLKTDLFYPQIETFNKSGRFPIGNEATGS
jgi:hypothetical protein